MASLSEYYEIVTPVFMLNPNIRAKKLQSNSVIEEMENGRGERIPTTKWLSTHEYSHGWNELSRYESSTFWQLVMECRCDSSLPGSGTTIACP
jgi:hypothetical protein